MTSHDAPVSEIIFLKSFHVALTITIAKNYIKWANSSTLEFHASKPLTLSKSLYLCTSEFSEFLQSFLVEFENCLFLLFFN